MTLTSPEQASPDALDGPKPGHHCAAAAIGGRFTAVLTAPCVARLYLGTIIGRLAAAMAPILVLLTEVRSVGSATAAALAGLQALAASLAQPLLARAADRLGAGRTLATAALAISAVFCGLAVASPRNLATVTVLTTLSGLCAPPFQSCQRVIVPSLVPADARSSALALDTTSSELVYIVAPLLAAAVVLGASPTTGYLLAAALGALGGAVVVLRRPADPASLRSPGPRSALRAPVLPAFLPMHLALGATIGSVPAAGLLISARTHHHAAPAALQAALASGALLGGLLHAALPASAQPHRRLIQLAAAFAVTWTPLTLAPDSPALALAVTFTGGLLLTPVLTTAQLLVSQHTPADTRTETCGWLLAALGLGEAAGLCLGGHHLVVGESSLVAGLTFLLLPLRLPTSPVLSKPPQKASQP